MRRSSLGRGVARFAVLLAAFAGHVHALSTGPTIPRSGAPGESNCASCHHATTENTRGTVGISFSGGNTYTPGVWKRVTITLTPNPATTAPTKYGFQFSARAGASRAGRFDIINDNSQTMAVMCAVNATAALTNRPAGGNCAASEFEYIQHNQPYFGFGLAAYTVSFLWQPPATDVGTVTLYATSVLGESPYATPTYPFRTSTTLTYQAAGTATDPVYPAGSLGLEALDTPSNKIVATPTVTANPIYRTAMKRDGSRVYALTLRGNQLLIIDPRNGALLNTISVLGTGVALSPDESRLYVAGFWAGSTSRLYVYNAATGAPLGTPLDFTSADYYFDVAPSRDGRRVYISPRFGGSTVFVIDAATVSQVSSIPAAAPIAAMTVSTDSSRLLVATVDGTTSASNLTIYSTATGTALAPAIALDPIPRGIVLKPDGSSAYVLTQDATNFVRITTIDIATATPVAQFWFPSPGYSYFFRISADGNYFYGGGNANPGGQPDVYAWSVPLNGSPVAIPSAQGILDIAVRPASAGPCAGFTDVVDTDPFCPSVQWMKNRAITVGCTTTSVYCPADVVSRLAMAAFMNRFGNAMTPINVTSYNSNFLLDLDANPKVCSTIDYTYSVPRTAHGVGVVGAGHTNGVSFQVEIVESNDGGTTWTPITLPHAVTAHPNDRRTASALVPATPMLVGTTYRFALRVTRAAGSPLNDLENWQCQLHMRFDNRVSATPPYDEEDE
jgi:sugar lactone lactonase YvrE